MSSLAFYGGSFNPPTIAHEAIVDHLVDECQFSQALVKPCGTRKDKPELESTLPKRRLLVKEKLSRPHQNYHLDLSAMDQPMIPTVQEWSDLSEKHPQSKISFIAGTDLFIKEKDGLCQIQKWIDGKKLFSQANFFIYPRPVKGELLLPPSHHLVKNFTPLAISSSELRAREKENLPK